MAALVGGFVVSYVWLSPAVDAADVVKFYGDKLRGSLFSGFLTLGGFLLSLKTFIIVKMKEALYDHKRYRKRVEDARKTTQAFTFYGELVRLKGLLLVAIGAAISTSVSQLTIGFIPHLAAPAVCLSLAGATVALLVMCLVEINANLSVWFRFLEADAKETEKEAAEKAAKEAAEKAAKQPA